MTIPLIVRLQGTKEKEAKQCVSRDLVLFPRLEADVYASYLAPACDRLIKESQMKIFAYDGLDEGGYRRAFLKEQWKQRAEFRSSICYSRHCRCQGCCCMSKE